MFIKIIEINEPYYVIIEHSGQDQVIDQAAEIIKNQNYEFVRGNNYFKHCRIPHSNTIEILKLTPLRFLSSTCSKPYASIFSTGPGYYYRAHKDGTSIRYALNYLIDVQDDCCVTSWYDDQISDHYVTNTFKGRSRELENFDKSAHQPRCSTVFKQNQCVLFNTDKYHDFDNRSSQNHRNVLTMRYSAPENFFWEDALREIKNRAN
jgi:hypothetical protein